MSKANDGFWAEKSKLRRSTMVPAVYQTLLDPENSEHLENFRIAAGLAEGPYRRFRFP